MGDDMEQLNFNKDKYKELALNIKLDENKIHKPSDAFFLMINGYDYESLDNLCTFISHHYYLDEEDSYKMTQNINLFQEQKQLILDLAYKCIKLEYPLGSKLVNNGKNYNTEWIGHCLNASIVSANLAKILGLNENIARTLGLLHDYGRKQNHTFKHTIIGFESLVDIDWTNEAISCLTHSFVNGGRCSNNEPAIEGFYIDKAGNPKLDKNIDKDDITLFLENYKYTDYDIILNIADLMTTSYLITSPYERIKDISSRKKIDLKNRTYFLVSITNTLIDFLKKINYLNKDFPYLKLTKNKTLSEIETIFKEVSNYFYHTYQELTSQKEIKIDELEITKLKTLIKESKYNN